METYEVSFWSHAPEFFEYMATPIKKRDLLPGVSPWKEFIQARSETEAVKIARARAAELLVVEHFNVTRAEYVYLRDFTICAKCGTSVLKAISIKDEGTGPESGNTFEYCSIHCRDTH